MPSQLERLKELLPPLEAKFGPDTQSFNTTTSMGRLTLNILLSFAQFEREVNGLRGGPDAKPVTAEADVF